MQKEMPVIQITPPEIKVDVLQLSYGTYVSLDDYVKLKQKLSKKTKTLDEIKKSCVDKINKSFLYDNGLSGNYKDRLFTETVIELQLIVSKIEELGSDNDE